MATNNSTVISLAKGGQYQRRANSDVNPPSPKKTQSALSSAVADTGTEAAAAPDRKHSHAPLSKDYNVKVRPFIDLIDNLRHYGLDKDVSLPSVAVIGDQSAGKSSALEAISGIQLPRGSGIVTRCPLELRLKSTIQEGKGWRAVIKYNDRTEGSVSREIQNPDDVGDYVRHAQERITGDKTGISDELITLDVESPEVPDLTLIDLPGIVRVAASGQDQDIGDQIKELIEERIERDETIILAVVPANQDIATTEAIKLAQHFDPSGERTLGVVTKPDLIDEGTESQLIAVVNNVTVPLKKGYTVVKCRGQRMINDKVTLEEALQQEEKFFKEQPHFKGVDQARLGVKNLSKKLTTELVNQIKGTIPSLKKDVATKMNHTQEELNSIGRGLPTDPMEMQLFCIEILSGFVDKLKENNDGIMFAKARKIYANLLLKIAEKTPDYGTSLFIQKIEEEANKHRGHELPRFMNYKVCKKLICEIITQYKKPTLGCLHQVAQLVEETMLAAADEQFAQFPELNSMVKGRVSEIRFDATRVCKDRIDEILEMEQIVFTQDKIYCHDLDIVKETHRQMIDDRTHQFGGFSPANSPKTPVKTVDLIQKVVTERLAKGHRVSSSSLHSHVEAEHRRTTAEEMFHMIQAYMEVSIRRLCDYIPLTITFHLIQRLQEKVRMNVLAIASEKDLDDIIYEDHTVASRRDALRAKLERLEFAKKALVKF